MKKSHLITFVLSGLLTVGGAKLSLDNTVDGSTIFSKGKEVVYSWQDYQSEYNPNAEQGKLYASMEDFANNLPQDNEPIETMEIPKLNEQQQLTSDTFKKIFAIAYENDEISNKLPFNRQYIEEVVLNDALKVYFAESLNNNFTGFASGKEQKLFVGLKDDVKLTMHTIFHEVAHNMGLNESLSEFLAEYLMGTLGETNRIADWEYGTDQDVLLFNACCQKGEEDVFFKAMFSEKQYRELWNKHIKVMDYDEFQMLRGLSKNLRTRKKNGEKIITSFSYRGVSLIAGDRTYDFGCLSSCLKEHMQLTNTIESKQNDLITLQEKFSQEESAKKKSMYQQKISEMQSQIEKLQSDKNISEQETRTLIDGLMSFAKEEKINPETAVLGANKGFSNVKKPVIEQDMFKLGDYGINIFTILMMAGLLLMGYTTGDSLFYKIYKEQTKGAGDDRL